jgi:hypothetical protein
MTPHIAEARRAAAQLLWAAAAGGAMTESLELMRFANELWPEPPLMIDQLADSPSPEAWRRATAAAEQARTLQEQRLGIDRAQAEAAERVVTDFMAART